MSDEQSQGIKKITLGLILSWGFGVLAAIAGISLLFSHPLTGILALLLAAVLLPPTNKFVADKFKYSISGGLKAIVAIVLLVLVGVSMPSSQTEPTANVEATASAQSDQTAVSTTKQTTQTAQTKIQPKTTTTRPAQQPATTPTVAPTNNQYIAPVSTETVSQKNAVRAAESYLNYSAFSHDGLVAQLEHDQFSQADATYGADNSGANWSAEAAQSAQSYLNYSAFSHDGLVAQLVHDQFTQAQAVYGVDSSNADWNEEAAKAAQQYMSYSAFSRGSLIAQLEHDQFTQAQAEYGANAVGL